MPAYRVVMNKGSYVPNLTKVVFPNGHEYFVDPYLAIVKNSMYPDDIRSYDELAPEELALVNQHGLKQQPNASTNSVDEIKNFIKEEIRKCLKEKFDGTS